MKNLRHIIFLLIGVILPTFGLFSQENISGANDSLWNDLYVKMNSLEQQRVRDSLKIDILNQELQQLIMRRDDFVDSAKKNQSTIDQDSILNQQKLNYIQKVRSKTEGSPVVLENDTLFRIFASLGPYTPIDRAKSAQLKIHSLYKKAFYTPDSLRITTSFNATMISYEDDVIQAVTDMDALWSGTTVKELASAHQQIINNAVMELRSKNSLKNKAIRFGELFVILLCVGFVLYLIRYAFRQITQKINNSSTIFNKGLKIRNYEIISKKQLKKSTIKALGLVKFVCYFIVLFFSIPIALRIFPSTEVWANELQKVVLEPFQSVLNSLVNYLPSLIKIIIIIIVSRLILRWLRFISLEIERESLTIKGFQKEWAKPTYAIIRFLFIFLVLILIFPHLPGSGTRAFQGVSVFLGVLLSLGSSSAISNAIAGILLTYMQPFKPNDWIKTGDIIGLVIKKDSLVTRLKTINNEDVTVPNSTILTNPTINFSSIGKTDGLALTAIVKIQYGYDERTVSNLLISAALKTSGITKRISPYVFQLELNEYNASYEINALTFEPENMFFIKSDLIKNIHNTFLKEGIPLQSIQPVKVEVKK